VLPSIKRLPGFKFIDCSVGSQQLLPMVSSIQAADFVLFVAQLDTDYTLLNSLLKEQLKCIRSIGVPRVEIAIFCEASQMQLDLANSSLLQPKSNEKNSIDAAKKAAASFMALNFAAADCRPFYLPQVGSSLGRKWS
jgi:hypothetical protein